MNPLLFRILASLALLLVVIGVPVAVSKAVHAIPGFFAILGGAFLTVAIWALIASALAWLYAQALRA